MNKKALGGAAIALIVILAIVLILVFWVMGAYNGLVAKDTNAQRQWGNVQSAYQRRLDLIPNLVATVQGSAEFESGMQTKIAELRSQASKAQTPSDLSQLDVNIKYAINFVVEAYPQVKTTENFLTLQSQLEGTENRINYERTEYNRIVQEYQMSVRSFPTNVIANMFGFTQDKWKPFEADTAASQAPTVKFDFNK